MGRLEGRIAVVTGGAGGIGAATVRRFVQEGAAVVVADIRADAAEPVLSAHGGAVRYAVCDVTVEADVAAAVDLAVERFGRLDVMVNNAGVVGVSGPVDRTTEADWDETLAVLLKGVFLGTKHAARVMKPQGSGVIVNTSSTAGVVGGLGPHAYTAAKHGVIGLTKSVANELGPYGIRVNAVAPGSTVTPLVANLGGGDPADEAAVAARLGSRVLLGTAIRPEDVADGVLYLAGDEARAVTGHTLVIDAGQTSSGTEAHRFHLEENQ